MFGVSSSSAKKDIMRVILTSCWFNQCLFSSKILILARLYVSGQALALFWLNLGTNCHKSAHIVGHGQLLWPLLMHSVEEGWTSRSNAMARTFVPKNWSWLQRYDHYLIYITCDSQWRGWPSVRYELVGYLQKHLHGDRVLTRGFLIFGFVF